MFIPPKQNYGISPGSHRNWEKQQKVFTGHAQAQPPQKCSTQVSCGSQAPQSSGEWLNMGHLKVYQKDQKHLKYVEVRAAVKKAYRQAGEGSRGIRQPRKGQATCLGSGMTDGRFKTGHH